MPEPIMIRYRAEGVPQVNAAFDSIERRIVRLTTETQKGATTRTRAVHTEASSAEQAYAKVAKDAERWQAEQTRTQDREERRRVQLVERNAKTVEKLAAQQAREEERHAAEGTRALEREMRRRDAIRERSATMAGRYAEQEARAEASARQRVGTTMGGAASRGAGRVIGGLASLGGMAVGALGAFSVADAVRERFSAERAAAQLINLSTAGGVRPAGANIASILGSAGGVAIETGMSKDQILGGTVAYSKNARGGDFAGAMGNMGFFAKLAKTTGTDINEIAGAAGKLQSQNPELNAPAMQQMLLNMYEMSKAGSVGFAEAAGQIGTLASTRGMFQGSTGKNQQDLFALGQIAASGGMSGDIGTYVKDFALETAAKRRKTSKDAGFGGKGTEALGVHFNATGQMESVGQAVSALFEASGGDLSKLHGIVGNRGMPILTEVFKTFQNAGGGAKGAAAVREQIDSVAGSSMTTGQLDQQFQQVMNTTPERFAKAVETIREHLEEKLVPMLDHLAEKFGDPQFMMSIEKVIDELGGLASFLLEHPFAGIGLAMAASITAELAKAALGNVIELAITKSLGTATTAQLGALGAAAGVAAAALLAVGTLFGLQSSMEAEANTGGVNRAKSLGGAFKKGNLMAGADFITADVISQNVIGKWNSKSDLDKTSTIARSIAGDPAAMKEIAIHERAMGFQNEKNAQLQQANTEKFQKAVEKFDVVIAGWDKKGSADPAHGARNQPIHGGGPR